MQPFEVDLNAGESGSVSGDELVPRGHETILLIEDDQGVLELLTDFLSGLGYQVRCARDLNEALELTAPCNGEVMLAISDVMMGRENGVDIVRHLREVRADLPVVFMSAYADGVLETTGHTFFVRKPFTLEGIAAITRHAIDHSSEPA